MEGRRRPPARTTRPGQPSGYDYDGDAREAGEFRTTYRSFADRIERFLTQVVILALVALVLVQTLQTNSAARRMLSLVERLEGVPASDVQAWGGAAAVSAVAPAAPAAAPLDVTIVVTSQPQAPQARVLVDGKPVATFAAGKVTVPVHEGQSLAIDASALPADVSFRVVAPPSLTSPALGTSVTTHGDTRPLGVVRAQR